MAFHTKLEAVQGLSATLSSAAQMDVRCSKFRVD